MYKTTFAELKTRAKDELTKAHTEISGIKLAKNAGHQNALFGGLMTVKDNCDCAISIDADLQDDIHVIPDMVSDSRQAEPFLLGTDFSQGIVPIRQAHVCSSICNPRD